MATQNRLGWTAEMECDYGTFQRWIIVDKCGRSATVGGFCNRYASQDEAEKAIAAEVAKRDRRNQASRIRHGIMVSHGLRRCANGMYE